VSIQPTVGVFDFHLSLQRDEQDFSEAIPTANCQVEMIISQRYFERDGDRILFRFVVSEAAVFDVLTDDVALDQCRQLLRGQLGTDVDTVRMGSFGPFDVTMSLGPRTDKLSATVFICGPNVGLAFRGDQTAAAYLTRSQLLDALDETVLFPTP
jgi:hypothetical protein